MKSLKTVALGVVIIASFIFVINELPKVFVSVKSSSQLAQVGGGATHYVRAGASGNGSDWANAYCSLPSSLVRGDTYYIADGTYSGYSFNTPASGTQYITIKKAIESDHGTNAGWQSGYGDGQALFNSMWQISTGYLIVDG